MQDTLFIYIRKGYGKDTELVGGVGTSRVV